MREYREELPIDSFIAVKDLDQLIREISKQEIKKIRFDKSYPATIASTPAGGTASVKLQGGTTTIPDVKIRAGVSVSYGDQVWVNAIGNSLTNLYIDLGNFSGTSYKFGDVIGGNYSEFESDGTLKFNGNATVFVDLLAQLIGERLESPSSDIVQNNTEGAVTFKTSATTSDYVVINTQLNHSWKLGSPIYPHIHWWQTSSTMPNWLLQYRWQKQCSAKTTSWTSQKYTSNSCPYVSGTLNQITGFGSITPPVGYMLSDIVQFRVIRDTTNASGLFSGSDGLGASVDAVNFDVHIELDGVGSRQEYVK